MSAGITLVSTIIALLLTRKWHPDTINPIDARFRRYFCDRLRRVVGEKNASRWSEACFALVLTLSDQQLVTGNAILITAMYMLNDGSISVYHFNLVTDLAWFSSNTHLLSLLIVRAFLYSSKSKESLKNDKWRAKWDFWVLRWIRVLLMLTLAGLLLYASWVSGYEYWYENLRCPASCVENLPKGGTGLKWTIVNFVLIIQVYPIQVAFAFPSLKDAWLDKARPWILMHSQNLLVQTQENRPLYVFLKVVQKAFAAVWYFLASETEACLEQIAWFTLGVIWTVGDRRLGHQSDTLAPEEAEAENQLGFGQFVPLLLLILPLLTLVEAYHTVVKDEEKETEEIEEVDVANRNAYYGNHSQEATSQQAHRRVPIERYQRVNEREMMPLHDTLQHTSTWSSTR